MGTNKDGDDRKRTTAIKAGRYMLLYRCVIYKIVLHQLYSILHLKKRLINALVRAHIVVVRVCVRVL